MPLLTALALLLIQEQMPWATQVGTLLPLSLEKLERDVKGKAFEVSLVGRPKSVLVMEYYQPDGTYVMLPSDGFRRTGKYSFHKGGICVRLFYSVRCKTVYMNNKGKLFSQGREFQDMLVSMKMIKSEQRR